MRVEIVLYVDPNSQKAIQYALDQLFVYDIAWLLAHPNTPALYQSGVRYEREPWAGKYEEFLSIPFVLDRGWGDCDDLSCWRAAEIAVTNTYAKPLVIEAPGSREGARRWHCVVDLGGGRFDDPSLRLGMRGSS